MRLLCATGKLSWGKGTHVLAAAMPRIRGAVPDTECLFLGDTPGRVSTPIPSGPGITVRPSVPHNELAALIDQADICVHPAVWPEPYSRVVLEYLAAGKPVVASRVGGIPEQIHHGVTGLLVRRNDPVELAQTLTWLLCNPDAREQLGMNALAWSVRCA